MSLDEMTKYIGVKTLKFLSIDGIYRKYFGEPTKLGAFIRNIYNYTSLDIREKISKLFR
jgi:hypothetical protein